MCWGEDRLLTKVSGVFRNHKAESAMVYLYKDCAEIARTGTGANESYVPGVTVAPGEVELVLAPRHQAVVVWNAASRDI